jgi:hypothetical protein
LPQLNATVDVVTTLVQQHSAATRALYLQRMETRPLPGDRCVNRCPVPTRPMLSRHFHSSTKTFWWKCARLIFPGCLAYSHRAKRCRRTNSDLVRSKYFRQNRRGYRHAQGDDRIPARDSLCPIGGIGAQYFIDFLGLPNVICADGSWLCPANAIRNHDWDWITQLAEDVHHAIKLAS